MADPVVVGLDPLQQQVPADFAAVGDRQFRQGKVLQGPFVPGQDVVQPGLELGGRDAAMGGDDAGHHPLAAEVVGHAGRDGSLDAGNGGQGQFHLMRIDVLAGRDDHVGAAAQDVELPVRKVALVPHCVPAVKAAKRLAVVAPQVAVADHPAADADIAGLAVGKRVAVVVQDPDVHAGKRLPDAGPAGVQRLPGGQARTGNEAQFRGAVVLEDGGVGCPAACRFEGAGIKL